MLRDVDCADVSHGTNPKPLSFTLAPHGAVGDESKLSLV